MRANFFQDRARRVRVPQRWFASAILFLQAVVLVVLGCKAPPSPTAPDIGQESSCTGEQTTREPCDEVPTLPTFSQGLPCPSRRDVEEIQREIPVTVRSDLSAGTLTCREEDGSLNLSPAQFGVYTALLFLREIRFDEPLPWTSLPVYEWLRTAIPKGILIDSTGDSRSCVRCPGPVVLVYDGKAPLRSTFDYLPYSVIVHEARHAEGRLHTCGYQTGNYRKDETIAEMGAFGVQYYLNYWIAHHSDEDQLVRLLANGDAINSRQGGGAFCCECLAHTAAALQTAKWSTDAFQIVPPDPLGSCDGAVSLNRADASKPGWR
jgi:hypothetical protein